LSTTHAIPQLTPRPNPLETEPSFCHFRATFNAPKHHYERFRFFYADNVSQITTTRRDRSSSSQRLVEPRTEPQSLQLAVTQNFTTTYDSPQSMQSNNQCANSLFSTRNTRGHSWMEPLIALDSESLIPSIHALRYEQLEYEQSANLFLPIFIHCKLQT